MVISYSFEWFDVNAKYRMVVKGGEVPYKKTSKYGR